MSWFFYSGSQSIGALASASVIPMNIQGWFPLGWTGSISLLSKGPSRVFSSITVQKDQFFGAQSNSPYGPTLTPIHNYWKTHSFNYMDLWRQSDASERVKVKFLSHIRLFATPWTVACQFPLPMEFSRQEYWSGFPIPSPGDLPNPGVESKSPTLQADSLPSEPPGKSLIWGIPGIVHGQRNQFFRS